MTTTLLVLLVGEMLTPFQGDFRNALPYAFPEGLPDVAVGITAPPGRTVAWVTVQAAGLEIEVVLHTARIPGDLRRVLRFTAEDGLKDRARAAAFTLAAMVRERDADLKALEPPPPPGTAAPLPSGPAIEVAPAWVAHATAFAGFDLLGFHGGAGLGAGLRRELVSWLQLGVGVEVGVFSTPAAMLVQPAFFAEAAVPLSRGRFSSAAVLGLGVAAPILSRDALNITTWLPLLHLAIEGRLALSPHQGLRFALSGQLVTRSLSVEVGGVKMNEVGPAWITPEIGYFAEL